MSETILRTDDPADDGRECRTLVEELAEPPLSPESTIVLRTEHTSRTLAMSHRDRVAWELTALGKDLVRREVDNRERSDEIAEDWRDRGEDEDDVEEDEPDWMREVGT